ncbi:helix-turn-helix domain-containing protein [Acuticoccus sediminis]|nr:helix-turn-helix transcriptional regulator [Acuticoccus sediminis]
MEHSVSREAVRIGERLRAFRVGSGLTVDEVADRLSLSRAAVYRFEKEGIQRIETLERVARMMNISVGALLGVSVEYATNPVEFFERLRQLEASADWLFVAFGPAYLLTGDAWDRALMRYFADFHPLIHGDRAANEKALANLMKVLARRKRAFRARPPAFTNIVEAADVEHLAVHGFGEGANFALDDRQTHRRIALEELEQLAQMLERPPLNNQIGVLFDSLPSTSFSLARREGSTTLTISPFRLGARPSLRNGVSMITSAREAVELHMDLAHDLWRRSVIGEKAAAFVRDTVATALRESPLAN